MGHVCRDEPALDAPSLGPARSLLQEEGPPPRPDAHSQAALGGGEGPQEHETDREEEKQDHGPNSPGACACRPCRRYTPRRLKGFSGLRAGAQRAGTGRPHDHPLSLPAGSMRRIFAERFPTLIPVCGRHSLGICSALRHHMHIAVGDRAGVRLVRTGCAREYPDDPAPRPSCTPSHPCAILLMTGPNRAHDYDHGVTDFPVPWFPTPQLRRD
jgi:hypothetical protein